MSERSIVKRAALEPGHQRCLDLVEGIVLHALEGSTAISDDDTLHAVEQLRSIYKLRLAAADSHANPGP